MISGGRHASGAELASNIRIGPKIFSRREMSNLTSGRDLLLSCRCDTEISLMDNHKSSGAGNTPNRFPRSEREALACTKGLQLCVFVKGTHDTGHFLEIKREEETNKNVENCSPLA
jgi:hypothetical protein